MRVYVAVLISAVAGVLIGAAAVYTLRNDEVSVQALIASLPDNVIEADLNEFSPAVSLDEYTKRLDSYFRVQSIHDISRLTSDFDQAVALYLILARAGEDDLKRYISQAAEISSTNQRMVVLSVIFGRYSALMPRDALDLALEHEYLTEQERSNIVWRIFSEWGFRDLDAAIDAIQSLPQGLKQRAAQAIMWRNDSLPPDQLTALAQRLGLTEDWNENVVDSIRRETYKDDPRTAYYDRIRDTTRIHEHTNQLSEIAKYWIELEGVAVLAEIYDSLKGADDRWEVLSYLIRNDIDFKTTKPTSVLQVISEFPNQQEASQIMEVAFRNWSDIDPEAAFNATLEYDTHWVSQRFREDLLYFWAHDDPEGLYELASTLPPQFQGIAVGNTLRKITQDSPQEAIRLARELDTRALRTSARNSIVQGWRTYDAKSAFEWLMDNDLDVNNQRNKTLWQYTFALYLDQDYDAARTFIDHHDGEFKEPLVKATAEHLFNSDIEQAMAYMQNADSEIRDSMLDQIAYSLGRFDSTQALNYGETLEQQQLDNYYEHVLLGWSYHDFMSLHKNIHRVPQKYQSFAAIRLLEGNARKHYLSDSEIKELELLVGEEGTPN